MRAYLFIIGFTLSSVVTRIDNEDYSTIEYPASILVLTIAASIITWTTNETK